MKSAAIIKSIALSARQALRIEKRRLKKAQAAERKLIKRYAPSPICLIENIEAKQLQNESAPTRSEMLQQAENIGMQVDNRWSNVSLMRQITAHMEKPTWAIQNASL